VEALASHNDANQCQRRMPVESWRWAILVFTSVINIAITSTQAQTDTPIA
jgi:hypothetical protein